MSAARRLALGCALMTLGCGQSAPAAPPPTTEAAAEPAAQRPTPEPRAPDKTARPTPSGDDAAEKPMNASDPAKRVAQYLDDHDLADPEAVAIAPGPSPLFDPLATAPFAFYQAMPRGGGPPGRSATPICVVVDTRDGTVHHQAPDVFENVARVLDLGRNPGRFTGDEWLTMAYVLRHGTPPTIAFGPTGAADKAVDARVTAPTVEARPDGGIVLTGWTSTQRGRLLTRHRITYSVDGDVSMSEDDGKSPSK